MKPGFPLSLEKQLHIIVKLRLKHNTRSSLTSSLNKDVISSEVRNPMRSIVPKEVRDLSLRKQLLRFAQDDSHMLVRSLPSIQITTYLRDYTSSSNRRYPFPSKSQKHSVFNLLEILLYGIPGMKPSTMKSLVSPSVPFRQEAKERLMRTSPMRGESTASDITTSPPFATD